MIEDFASGKPVEVRALAYGTDCYPRKEIETTINIEDLNQAIMINPRNAYQRYNVATNSTDHTLYTYMGMLLPHHGNATYCGAGELSPLFNDPLFETIGIGTRIFLCGAKGYIIGEGTQHNPKNNLGTLMMKGNLKEMSTDFSRAAIFHKYGTTLYVGIGIPIPILDEEIALRTGVSDDDIVTNVLDYGVARRERPVLRKVSYKELKSGNIELNSKEVRTAPLSSYFMAKKVAEELKAWIERGEFMISQPVERLRRDTVFKPMKQIKELPLVKDVMISEEEVITIKEDATIEEAVNVIMKGQFTHLPIISDGEKLVGIVTAWDISKAVAKRYRRLEEIMTRRVLTADSEDPLELVVRKLEKYNISALPVIERDRKVIGMVTSDSISRLVGRRGRRRA